MEWTRGNYSEAWVRYDHRNHHVFRESDQYQVEYTDTQGRKATLHRVRYSRYVQTHHIRFYYNVLKTTFENVELLGQNTESLIVQLIDKGNIVHKMCEMYMSFDLSELNNTSYYYGQLVNHYEQKDDKSKFPSLS